MGSSAETTVFLADFQFLTREAIRYLINDLPGFTLLEHINRPEDLEEKVFRYKPHLLVLDIDEDDPAFIEKIKSIRQKIKVHVLIITNTRRHDIIQSLLQEGIKGIVTKNCSEGEIINALKAVAIGNRFYCNNILNMVMEVEPESVEKTTPLTSRELEVLKLIAEGNTTQVIANKLFISIHTVNSHRKNILRKLNISSPIHLVAYAVEHELVKIDL